VRLHRVAGALQAENPTFEGELRRSTLRWCCRSQCRPRREQMCRSGHWQQTRRGGSQGTGVGRAAREWRGEACCRPDDGDLPCHHSQLEAQSGTAKYTRRAEHFESERRPARSRSAGHLHGGSPFTQASACSLSIRVPSARHRATHASHPFTQAPPAHCRSGCSSRHPCDACVAPFRRHRRILTDRSGRTVKRNAQ